MAGRFCTAHDKIMAALRDYLPTKLPPIKTLIMPLGLIAAVFPTMSAYEWGTTSVLDASCNLDWFDGDRENGELRMA